jgi:hypothetical protein
VRAFEPDLDIWAISTYPYFIFSSAGDIPADYYTPLASESSRPLAVAESGFTSRPVENLQGSPQSQAQFLNALHDQLGARLRFWVNLLLTDFDLDSYRQAASAQGRDLSDIDALAWFAGVGLRENDGRSKPAMDLWMSFWDQP